MNIFEEEFCRYTKYINYSLLKDKTFLITGAKGYLASATIRFLLYLNKTYNLNLFIYGATRNPTKIPDYIQECQAIKYINFDTFDNLIYDRPID